MVRNELCCGCPYILLGFVSSARRLRHHIFIIFPFPRHLNRVLSRLIHLKRAILFINQFRISSGN